MTAPFVSARNTALPSPVKLLFETVTLVCEPASARREVDGRVLVVEERVGVDDHVGEGAAGVELVGVDGRAGDRAALVVVLEEVLPDDRGVAVGVVGQRQAGDVVLDDVVFDRGAGRAAGEHDAEAELVGVGAPWMVKPSMVTPLAVTSNGVLPPLVVPSTMDSAPSAGSRVHAVLGALEGERLVDRHVLGVGPGVGADDVAGVGGVHGRLDGGERGHRAEVGDDGRAALLQAFETEAGHGARPGPARRGCA